MPIEIREIVVKARVDAESPDADGHGLSDQLKRELCEQWRRELDEERRARRRERIPGRLER